MKGVTGVTLTLFFGLVLFVDRATDAKSTGPSCVRTCRGKRNGYYQSCQGCNVYVTCSNGRTYDKRPCPARLVWNDKRKRCLRFSTTCVLSKGMPIDGQWSEWRPWSACSKTCGGGVHRRSRLCTDPKPQDGGAACVGVSQESIPCAQWDCPDCDRPCPPGGQLAADCSVCECANAVLTGQVLNQADSIPLVDVSVYVMGRQWHPSATTDRLGQFELKDLCISGLKLTFKKSGFMSELDVYNAENSNPIVIKMKKLEKPIFTMEPQDSAGFVGGSVTLRCKATAVPHPTSYDWFKEDNLLFSEPAADESFVSVYEISSLKLTDAGYYACRAVSKAGKKFSQYAQFTVDEVTNSRRRKRDVEMDTCEELPKPGVNIIKLPVTCKATIDGNEVDQVDLGRCGAKACRNADNDTTPRCCRPVQTALVTVACAGFSYDLPVATSCGCSECDSSGGIGVNGVIDTGLIDSVPKVDIVSGGNKYGLYNRRQFYFETTAEAGRVVFSVVPWRYFMPQVVSLDVASLGITEVFVQVNLVKRPERVTIDANVGGIVPVVSEGKPLAGSIVLPANATVDQYGLPVVGDIDVYVTFADPRVKNGLSGAPGQFTFLDEEGKTRSLKTYGVVTLVAEQKYNEPVYLQGTMTVKLQASNLGISRTRRGNANALMWSFDSQNGNWQRLTKLTFPGRRQRKQAIARPEFPSEYPIIKNINEPLPVKDLCEVAVYVYQDGDFVQPLPGELITVLTARGQRVITRSTGLTNEDGKACIAVPCGYTHTVTVGTPSRDVIVVSRDHSLPSNFRFENIQSYGVKFSSPKIDDIVDSNGPVFLYRKCRNQPKKSLQYHFTMAVLTLRPAVQGQLAPVETRPRRELSWYREAGNSAQKEACMVRLDVLTLDPQRTQVVGESRRKDGSLYGSYMARVIQALNPYSYVPLEGNYRACVQVRCPKLEDDPTYVDLELSHPDRDSCVFKWTALGEAENVNMTNAGLSLQLVPVWRENKGFYRASGPGNSAYRQVLNECSRGGPYAALFDCAGSRVKHLGWG